MCGVTFQKVDERGLEPMPTPESPPNVALPSDESLRAELDAYHPPAEPFCYAHLSQKNNGSNEDGDNVRDLWLRARKCSIEGYTVPLYKNNMLQENNTPDLLQENNTLRETVAKVQQVAESNARIIIGRNAELQRLFRDGLILDVAKLNKELEAAKAEVLSLMRARDEARKDHFAALEACDALRQKRNDAVSELNAELEGISVIRKEFGAKENETFYDFVHRLADDGESRLLEIGRLLAKLDVVKTEIARLVADVVLLKERNDDLEKIAARRYEDACHDVSRGIAESLKAVIDDVTAVRFPSKEPKAE